jgi:hypothetical protein
LHDLSFGPVRSHDPHTSAIFRFIVAVLNRDALVRLKHHTGRGLLVEGYRTTLIIGGLTSGALSAAMFFFAPSLIFIGPGVLFAIFVAIPWMAMCGRSVHSWGMAALCILGYFVAYLITVRTDLVGAPIGAGVGTFIMLAPSAYFETANVRKGAWTAINTGTLAAGVFTGFSFVPQGWWGIMLGFVVWQVAVAAALSTAISKENSAAKMENGPLTE